MSQSSNFSYGDDWRSADKTIGRSKGPFCNSGLVGGSLSGLAIYFVKTLSPSLSFIGFVLDRYYWFHRLELLFVPLDMILAQVDRDDKLLAGISSFFGVVVTVGGLSQSVRAIYSMSRTCRRII